jgi:hypothetical protein
LSQCDKKWDEKVLRVLKVLRVSKDAGTVYQE